MNDSLSQEELEDAHFEHLLAERKRQETLRRFAVLALGGSGAAAVTFFSLLYFSPGLRTPLSLSSSKVAIFTSALMVTAVIGAALLTYLRGSASVIGSAGAGTTLRLLQLENEVENQSRRIETKIKARYVDENTRSEIVKELKQDLANSVADNVLNEIQEKVRKSVGDQHQERLVRAQFDETLERLSSAIAALHLRANVNLVFGILMSVAGISILAYTLATPILGETTWDFIRNYLPRVTLVLVVELFAYFFLNLYKANLAETRYYHNEITNVAARRAGLLTALAVQDNQLVSTVVANLIKTERNGILSKSQTTVELAKAKAENEAAKDLSGTLVRVIDSFTTGGRRPLDD